MRKRLGGGGLGEERGKEEKRWMKGMKNELWGRAIFLFFSSHSLFIYNSAILMIVLFQLTNIRCEIERLRLLYFLPAMWVVTN